MKTAPINKIISTSAKGAHQVKRHSPRIKENDLDVENDEEHGGDVVLDREPAAADGLRGRLDAAPIRVVFLARCTAQGQPARSSEWSARRIPRQSPARSRFRCTDSFS